MHYSCGKWRLRKSIAEIIAQYREHGQLYIEPFLGGASVFSEVDNPRIGGELNKYVAAMWQAAVNGWTPRRVEEEEYYKMRDNMDAYPPGLVGFTMVAQSFGGNFAGAFARSHRGDDYFLNGKNGLMRKAQKMQGATIQQGSYTQFTGTRGAVIYCDPPYFCTRQKYCKTGFNSAIFWDWAREMGKENVVLVSEYSAPDDIQEIAQWELTKNIIGGKTEHKAIKRLYLVGDHARKYGQLNFLFLEGEE